MKSERKPKKVWSTFHQPGLVNMPKENILSLKSVLSLHDMDVNILKMN